MHTLKIEHPISDFETWRAAFQRDPAGREKSGVRGYRVFRPDDDARYILVDLDFDGAAEAERFLEKLREIWRRAELSPGLAREPGVAPRARIVAQVEV